MKYELVCCLKTCIIDANFEAQKVDDVENSNVELKHSTLNLLLIKFFLVKKKLSNFLCKYTNACLAVKGIRNKYLYRDL